jgi:lipopolysaccharide transport system permease protein
MPARSTSLSSDAEQWVITPETRDAFSARVREVWHYRRILFFFSINALQGLYRKTRLGMPWLFLRSLLPLAIGTFVFGQVMQVPSGAVPYFVFFTTGQLAWNVFDGPLVRASRGLDVNRQLLTKLYIPRVILPLGQMAAGLVDPLVMTGVLIGTLVYYRVGDGVWYANGGVRLFAVVPAVLTILAFAFSLSLWTSVWQARARDVRFVLRYIVSFWLYLTPVIYPLSHIPRRVRWLAYLNPLTAPVETFKWAVLPDTVHSWAWFGYSVGVTLVVFLTGAVYFGRAESATVDRL